MGNKIEAYIQEYMKVTEKQLIERPQHIARDFNIESSMTRDYAGRQLLELIQNADDAAVSAVKKHMLILIDEEKLIVANNGEPFTKEGFDSLFFSHLSPKIHDESIGHKGLGFRAVLSWAHEITIYSSGITVRFSEEIAQEFWDRIKTHNGLEDRVLRSTNKDIGECPIAMLSIPQIVAEPRPGLPDYDTVIELTLRPDILDEVEAQLEEIMQPEALLFFNQLDQVKIVNHGSETIITRKIENTPAGKKSTVSIKKPDCKEPTVKTWHLLEHQWVTRVNQQTNKDHIIMAYNEELDDDVNSLYSYYPTNVEFTAPFIVHASFDVTSDRKGLSDGSSKNKDIFRELAGFICRSAEKLASDGHYDPGFALRFLGIDKNGCDSIAYRMGFFEALQKHLSSCKIIPTVNDEFISFDDGPKVLPKHICSYFSGNDVWDLVNGDHIKSFKVLMQLVDRQEVVYNIDKLCSMIHQRARKLPARSLVYLYLHLAEKYEKELFKLSYCDPIMLNIDGEYIDPKSQVFFSLDNKVIYDIPNDLAIDFLDEAVSQELAEGGNLEKMENAFGVHHYSFNEIANILISNYNEKDNVEDIKAMHRALFQVYSVATASKEDTDGVETGNVRLISKNGSIVTANEVYFGEGYDNRLTETIYRDLPHKILGAPEMIGLQKEGKQELIKYLAWLGVEKYPRLKEDYTNKINYGDNAKRKEALEFIKHIVLNYNYKEYKIGEYSFRDYSEFNEKQGLKDWGHIYKFTTVDELEAILKDIKVETLMEWILADKKLRKMLSEDHDTGGSLRVMIVESLMLV